MHYLYKIRWMLRGLFYKLIFGQFSFPSYIGKPIFLLGTKNIYINRRVRIFPGLRAEVHGGGCLVFHENVTIGQNFHITCMGELDVKAGTIISGDVMVTDIDHAYQDISKSVIDQPHVPSKTEIGENCFIGMGARIQAGTILGKGCVVGANAVVRGTFPPHSVIVGAPAKAVKCFNSQSGAWERC
ncbi:lipopolysaccharide biosynthesis O-acetyl transferase [gamma proteobacterium BDW918]|nr:lipopolysaccharide biosynthesis O-acetyl transferase [gamma proteobacterium BDW918]